MHELQVALGERSYPIYIGEGLCGRSSLIAKHLSGSRVAIVTNETVAPLYLQTLVDQLSHYEPLAIVLPDGERYKEWQTLQRIFDALLEGNCDRTVTLIALGGGVLGDMAGFAAACYQRGVDFIQMPTTLLSQVDSSVGGKTGINHPLGKNMIGAFYQPRSVLIDVGTLKTLPPRELSAGLAEVVKYGLICDSQFFAWLETRMEDLRTLQPDCLVEAIERSCRIKAHIVAQDERESGMRALLNLGHTFGHAIETAQGYGNWLHGEAVAVGTLMAAELSRLMGLLEQEDVQRIANLMERAGLPITPPDDMTPDIFLSHMQRDKKVLQGKLRLILLQGIGEAFITDAVEPELLQAALSADYRVLARSIEGACC